MSQKVFENENFPFIKNKIAIPKIGNAESLNAAVATGIILWKFCGKILSPAHLF